MHFKVAFTIVTCLQIFSGFAQSPDLQKQITTTIQAYSQAVEERNADKVIGFYDGDPGFTVFVNGQALDYKSFIANVKGHLPTCKQVSFRFDSLTISPIATGVVAASGIFHESFTEADGTIKAFTVPATWILIRKNGQWKFRQATAYYQPAGK
jgi:ketosteroid isomerase-like protein